MKKILSILTVISVTTLLTINETSCFCFRRNKYDLSDYSKIRYEDADYDTVYNAFLLSIEVFRQMAVFVNVDEENIQNDNKIHLSIYHSEHQTEVELDISESSPTDLISGHTYRTYVTIDSGDKYFEPYDSPDTWKAIQVV